MDARLPDAFLKCVVGLLPAQGPPRPQGGRKPIEHAIVLKVIWFVLTVGCRWKDVPPEMGCSGETARTRPKRDDGEFLCDVEERENSPGRIRDQERGTGERV